MNTTPHRARLVLTRQPQLPFERVLQAFIFSLLLALPLLLLLAPLWLDAAATSTLRSRLLGDPRSYLLSFILLALLYWQWRLRHHEHLQLDDQGIAYRPPFRWWPQPAVRLPWSTLERLELQPPRRGYPLLTTTLRLSGAGRMLSLKPLMWYPLHIDWAQQRARQRLQSRYRGNSTAAFADSALGQFFAQRGLEVSVADNRPTAFDLFSHRRATIAIATLAVLGLYSLLDSATLQQRALDYALWPIMVGAGAALFPLLLALLLSDAMPRVEAFGVSALLALAFALAAYPGSLRINQLSDPDGAETVTYQHEGHGRFVANGYPVIEQDLHDPFWQTIALNAPYAFQLYRGSLGFWQLDEAPVNAAMQAYYRRQQAEFDSRDN